MKIVHFAAENLIADLNRAEQWSNHWANQQLGQALVDVAIDRCLHVLASTGVWGRENMLVSSGFWQIAGPQLERGSLHCRARFKPRGYAGDFETFVMFWERTVCNDSLGRLFDCYFQRQAAVEAVRARTEAVAATIAEHALISDSPTYGITSIGCGPAIDIQRVVQLLPSLQRSRLKVQLFDLDEMALVHANERLRSLLGPTQLTTHRENLYRLATRANADELLMQANFIFCTGLFDYLSHESAIDLLRFMWRQLKSGGKLVVGNFAPHNPTRAYMEWFGNWYLLYRTKEQLADLAMLAGIPQGSFCLMEDSTGVQLLLTAIKP